MNKIKYYTLLLLLVPAISFAEFDGIRGLLLGILSLMKILVPVVFSVALLYFFLGVSQFILKDAGNDKTREEGKKKMLWGIIALFVMVSIYGILQFIGGAVGIKVTTPTAGQNINL